MAKVILVLLVGATIGFLTAIILPLLFVVFLQGWWQAWLTHEWETLLSASDPVQCDGGEEKPVLQDNDLPDVFDKWLKGYLK